MYSLCKENKKYYNYLHENVSLDGGKSILEDVPPNINIENKYVLGFYEKDKMIAILDLIEGYPNNETAFIGLLILDVGYQGKGIARSRVS